VTGRAEPASGMSRWRSVQPAALLWLTLVWVALWRDLSLANVAAGLAVALGVTLAFPLPRLRLGGRVQPWHLTVLLVRFLYDVVEASLEVAWLTLRLRRRPRGAVVAVDLRSESDLVIMLVAELLTLVPGTLAVEAHRHTHTLFLHILDLEEADVETFRRRALEQERRVLRALGMDPSERVARREGGRP
jgi:multicomponent Na+:H+ antiporter subunit E